ncbi:hypothetical protein [Streptomyces tsukubensis]|uniref:hypothetical protein n=1 Tax=Streptomyces tsukubensis TaxID=83656 RepID=UPI00344BF23B
MTTLWTRMVIPVLLSTLVTAAGTGPAAGAGYVHQRANACTKLSGGGCAVGIAVKYWHKKGSQTRGVGWVYASKTTKKKPRARWLHQRPGAGLRAATGWKTPRRVGGFVETSWGKDGRTGPQHTKGTRVCVQFEGGDPLCVRLK